MKKKQIFKNFVQRYCCHNNFKTTQQQSSDFLMFRPNQYQIIYIRPYNLDKKNKQVAQFERPRLHLQREADDFLQIVNLLTYTNNKNVPPLNIYVIDTIFYGSQSPTFFLYYDEENEVLERINNKSNKYITNIIDKFLVRKNTLQKEDKGTLKYITYQTITQRNNKKTPTMKITTQRSKDKKKQNNIAVLKYREKYQSVEINQSDFLSILQNPLYINCRLKQLGNTLYIQRHISTSIITKELENDPLTFRNSISLDFDYNVFSHHPLFNMASDSVCKFSYNKFDDPSELEFRQGMKLYNIELYLYYIIFRITVYIYIHHNKKIIRGIFTFIKDEKDKYGLSSIQSLHIQDIPQCNSQYQKIDLLLDKKQSFHQNGQQQQQESPKGIFYDTAMQIFEGFNSRLKSKVDEFVINTFDFIQNQKDVKESNSAFNKLIQPTSTFLNFKDVLNSDDLMLSVLSRQKHRK